MRRRLRVVRRARDGRLLELGALVFELHRRERRDPKLLEEGVARVAALDVEERALAAALGTLSELPALASAAGCRTCGAGLPEGARFCVECGAPTSLDTPAGRPAQAPTTSAPRPELRRPEQPASAAVAIESPPVERDTRSASTRADRSANVAAER